MEHYVLVWFGIANGGVNANKVLKREYITCDSYSEACVIANNELYSHAEYGGCRIEMDF